MNAHFELPEADWAVTQADPTRPAAGETFTVSRAAGDLRVERAADGADAKRRYVLSAQWSHPRGLFDLVWREAACPGLQHRTLLAALHGVFTTDRAIAALALDTANVHADACDRLRRRGVLTADGRCLREAWAQQPDVWLVGDEPHLPAALSYTMTNGVRHPRRAPYRDGIVYARDVAAFGHRFTLRAASLERDLPLLHEWFNEPRVNAFWNEGGGIDAHRAYLERQLSAPHVEPLIGAFDGEPFGYFEAYWAKEDRIAPFAQPGEHDRGLHMLVGGTRWRGPDCVAAWLPSLVHYLFLDDPRTQAVMCEPRHDNERMIGYLLRHGFAAIKPFDLPHKRALLMRTIREAFFDARPI